MNARTVNLALQGGGAHGAITWGVIDRLLEDERLLVDSISGASAGAVNAVALAYGLHKGGCEGARETLDTLWRAISRAGENYNPVRRTPVEAAFGVYNLDNSAAYQFFDMFTRTFSPYAWNPFAFNPLRTILERQIDFDSLAKCPKTHLYLSATNVRTGKVQVFKTKDVSVDVVMASTCLPFLFQAVEIKGETYWDGGYMGNPVLFPFFYEAESQDIIIVHVNPIERDQVPRTSAEIVNRVNEISFNSSLLREMRAIAFVQRLLDEGWIRDEYRDRLRKFHIHSIRSDREVADLSIASKFSSDWDFLLELKKRGRAVAEEWLDANYASVGKRSTVDLRSMVDGGFEKD
ncbi:MAG: patatin-like phospholipase family protein [Parvularculaceae bacterium]|nr:patatin-like phospholipase family protein [Parvularculaceae bacterium]